MIENCFYSTIINTLAWADQGGRNDGLYSEVTSDDDKSNNSKRLSFCIVYAIDEVIKPPFSLNRTHKDLSNFIDFPVFLEMKKGQERNIVEV